MPPPTKNMSETLKATSSNLKISFPSTSITTPGRKLTKPDAQPAPTLSLKSPTPSKTYMSLSLDPDAPFPSFPFLGPILHGIQTGLAAEGEADGEGFVKLTAGAAPVAPWVAPAPPGISAPHRYLVLLWKQPEGVTDEKIREEMGWDPKGELGLGKRVRWDQRGFEERFGLGDVVAGNWFVCG